MSRSTSSIQALLDDPVRARQHVGRSRQADVFRRRQIDDEVELRRLLNGQVDRLRTFENLVDVHGYAMKLVGKVRCIEH